MKKRILLLLLAILLILSGCSEGEIESNNSDEIDGEYSSLGVVELITEEWKSSGHQYAVTATAGRGIGCASCHDGVGFSEQLEYASVEFEPAHQTGIDCQACHTGYGKDIIASGVVELPFMDEPFAGGLGATCAACHNGNRDPQELFVQSEIGELERYSYPHYGMNAALLTGQGGMEYSESEYIISIAHSEIDDSCVACHMPETEDGYREHTFKMDITYFDQTCGTCHVDGTATFNIGGLQDEVKSMLDQVEEAILEATGAARIDTGGGVFTYYDANDEVISEISHEAFVATYNWRLVAVDGSYGVHNPLYAKSLLQESYRALTGDSL